MLSTDGLKEWKIDFTNQQKIVATEGGTGKLIPLKPHARPIAWFYEIKDKTWAPISQLNNFKIDQFRAESQKNNNKVTVFNIRENIRSSSVIEKFFKKAVTIEFSKKKLKLGNVVFEIRHEKEIDQVRQFKPDMPRAPPGPHAVLTPNDVDFVKVRDAFHLTLPTHNVKSITRFYHTEILENYQRAGMKVNQPSIGLLNEKLLWSWDFTPETIAIKETSTSSYGKGYYFSSDAALAVSLRPKSEPKRIVLSQVYLGRMFFSENRPKEYDAVADFFHTLVVRSGEGWLYVVPEVSRILPSFLVEYE